MSSKVEITAMINDMEQKLKDTQTFVSNNTGPVEEALSTVIPMLEDQLKIMQAIVEHPMFSE